MIRLPQISLLHRIAFSLAFAVFGASVAPAMAAKRGERLPPLAPVVIAVKWISFLQPNKKPIYREKDARLLLDAGSSVWGRCRPKPIRFDFEEYEVIDPAQFGFPLSPDREETVREMAGKLADPRYLIVLSTDPFGFQVGSKTGKRGLFGRSTLAGTVVPSADKPGVVIVPKIFAQMGGPFAITAHELGHYFGLEHVADSDNIMYPSPEEGRVTFEQCATILNALADPEYRGVLRASGS